VTVQRVRLARKTQGAPDIFSFELVAVDGVALPSFPAGSHIEVGLDGGLTRRRCVVKPEP